MPEQKKNVPHSIHIPDFRTLEPIRADPESVTFRVRCSVCGRIGRATLIAEDAVWDEDFNTDQIGDIK